MADVEICACGHVRSSHLIRWALTDHVRTQVAAGHSACNECRCTWYIHVLSADVTQRDKFRNRQKLARGNFGSTHPLVVGLSKANPELVSWEPLECGGCSRKLEPKTAIALDSRVYCAGCFMDRAEVYLDH